MNKLVMVFDNEEFIATAFIEGLKYVKGEYGWFTSLELLTLDGRKIEGWGLGVYPFTLMLEFKDEQKTN